MAELGDQVRVRRSVLHRFTGNRRLLKCGTKLVKKRMGATLTAAMVAGAVVAGVAGSVACGAFWLCAVCAREKSKERHRQVVRILRKVATAEGTVAQMTFTFSHSVRDSLSALWDVLSYAFSKITSGKRWVAEQQQFGITGWFKSVEVKRSSRFGWHIHLHLYPTFDRQLSDRMLRCLGEEWFVRWQRACARKGLRTSYDAFYVQRMDLTDVDAAASYMVKPTSEKIRSAAHEVTSAVHKIGRPVTADDVEDDGNEHLDRFEILDRAGAGDREALGWWREFEEASHNRESFRISSGLKAWAATAPDDTPAEVLEAEKAEREAQRPQPVVLVTAEGWKLVLRHDVAELLRQMERAGTVDGARAAAIRWLDARGIGHREPDVPVVWGPFPFEDDPFVSSGIDPPF